MVRELTETLKSLADTTRLQMLALLTRRGELCVCDLEHALNVSQSSASRQLGHLVRAGLVQSRRRGTWMHCRVSASLSADQAAIVAGLQSSQAFAALDPALEERLDEWLASKDREATAGAACGCQL